MTIPGYLLIREQSGAGFQLPELSTDPAQPESTKWKLYFKSTGLFYKEDDNTVHEVALIGDFGTIANIVYTDLVQTVGSSGAKKTFSPGTGGGSTAGINIGDTVTGDPAVLADGDIWREASAFKAYFGAAAHQFVFHDQSVALTNKTIDGDLNTISNLAHGAEVDNPSTGVHGVTGAVVGTTDSQTLTTKVIDGNNNTLTVLAASQLSGATPIANGGTGQTAQTAAFDALAPTTTQGDLIYHNGTDNIRLAKGTADQVLTMNAGATAPEWQTPSAGSGVPKQYVLNGGFEIWRGPTSWTNPAAGRPLFPFWQFASSFGGSVTVSQDTTNVDTGRYSVAFNITSAGAGGSVIGLRQIFPTELAHDLRGKAMTFSARVKGAAASTVKLRIQDSAGTTDSSQNSGTTYETLSVTRTIDSAATSLIVFFLVDGDQTGTNYFDTAVFVEGSSAGTYLPTGPADLHGAWTVLGRVEASSSATADLDLTVGTDVGMKQFQVMLIDVVPATDGVAFYMRFSDDGGSSFEADAGDYNWSAFAWDSSSSATRGSTSDTEIEIVDAVSANAGSDTGEGLCGFLNAYGPADSTIEQYVTWHVGYQGNAGTSVNRVGSGFLQASVAVTDIRFLFSSGNIESGTFVLLGAP